MPGYKKGQSIRLFSCNTGTLNHGFAQDLANKLNVTVWAQAHICGLILTGNTSLLIKRLSTRYQNPITPKWGGSLNLHQEVIENE